MSTFSELEQAIRSIESQLETLAYAVGALDERVAKIGDVADLFQENVPWLEDEIETLRHRLSNVESKVDCDED